MTDKILLSLHVIVGNILLWWFLWRIDYYQAECDRDTVMKLRKRHDALAKRLMDHVAVMRRRVNG